MGWRTTGIFPEPGVNMDSSPETPKNKSRSSGLIYGLIPVVMMAVVLLISSGDLFWVQAWIFILIHTGATIILVMTIDPSLIRERMALKENRDRMDGLLVMLLNGSGLLVLLIAGLDIRLSLTGTVSPLIPTGGFILFITGYVILIRSAIENPFFSAVVRIQDDRKHRVITSGMYRYIRHPGYLGIGLCIAAEPMLFGSVWAVIPVLVTILILLVRIRHEEEVLCSGLAGYTTYCGQVTYRLIPGIW